MKDANELMSLYQLYCKNLKNEGLANSELNEFKNFSDIFTEEEFKLVLKEKQRRKDKRYRTNKKFGEMLEYRRLFEKAGGKIVFGTCTLNDKELKNEERTRTKKLDKWLKYHFTMALVNKDFGKKNEREHYHFIGFTFEELEDTGKRSKSGYKIFELKNKNYTLGFEPDLCIIDLKANDRKQTTNYLLKLNNHSSKITTKNRLRVIKNYQYRLIQLHIKKDPRRG